MKILPPSTHDFARSAHNNQGDAEEAMAKFGHWGPNAGPPPIKGRDSSPRRTVVNRTGGGFKYREDVEAMRFELRTLREKLDGAEFALSEGAAREYAVEARVAYADQQLAQERETWEAWHTLAAEREAALQATLREALEAVGTARDAAQSALGSSAETHADLHHRAEECGALQRRLAAAEDGARQTRRDAADATGRSSELQREAEALATELEEAHAERAELRTTLARASEQLMRAVDGVQQERSDMARARVGYWLGLGLVRLARGLATGLATGSGSCSRSAAPDPDADADPSPSPSTRTEQERGGRLAAEARLQAEAARVAELLGADRTPQRARTPE